METKIQWLDKLAKQLLEFKREIDGKDGFDDIEQKVMEILIEIERIKTLTKLEDES